MDLNSLQVKARQGDRQAEERLFQYLHVNFRLFAQHRVWNAEDSEEVVQDALKTIVIKYKDLEVETSFAAWAHGVLIRKILDYVKVKQLRAAHRAETSNPVHWHGQAPPDPALKSRLLDCLKKVSRIHRQHARVLTLHYQGYSTSEICQRLKVKTGNFYVMLSRARIQMARCLETGAVD